MQRNQAISKKTAPSPVPAASSIQLDIPWDDDLKVSIEKRRLVTNPVVGIPESDFEDFDITPSNTDEDDCGDCSLRCPECGACLYELLENFGVDVEQGGFDNG